jgi:hypothetical protein
MRIGSYNVEFFGPQWHAYTFALPLCVQIVPGESSDGEPGMVISVSILCLTLAWVAWGWE